MTAPIVSAPRRAVDIEALETLEERILWLASWTIHNANHLRESRDGLKVGGHQASCASMTTLMTALYFHALRPQDRVAVKPHASPVFHAIQHLFGRQTIDQLKRFRALGGAQSYPSRTKDIDDVDFSTGSVGLGVAVTAFSSLVQDYLAARDKIAPERQGRFIATLGDAELDEGNIYEALIEGYKHDIRNTWWIVDYNRQSLDATTSDRMWDRFDDIFATAGWRVETLKFGRRQTEAFQRPGGGALKSWIESCPNDLYAALTFEGGTAWRDRLTADLGRERGMARILGDMSDADLQDLMTRLGGHCMETMIDAYDRAAKTDQPTMFIAYTIKGWRLPFQGHKDNHSGLMNPGQVSQLRERLGVPEGSEWDILSGLSDDRASRARKAIADAPFSSNETRRFDAPEIAIPNWSEFPRVEAAETSTQQAFGKILHELSKRDDLLADSLVTTSPDVTVSTNLGAFVNRRGLFSRESLSDIFKDRRIASPQTWSRGPRGQHIELGIAEHNLFLALAALGLAAPHFGTRLLPIGTLYDPFIARGLDALNYAVYQDARFLLVATPSGVTLGPEGGAHQSVSTPLIGIGQPGLTYWEPAFADELALLFRHALVDMQAKDGKSAYFRLSTRQIEQPKRTSDDWMAGADQGAYWLVPPGPNARVAIAYTGAIAPEAREAHSEVLDDDPEAGLLAITSADILHAGWTASLRAPWTQSGHKQSHVSSLLGALRKDAALVTVVDGAPATLSWLGSVDGRRVAPLGIETFGQTGDLPDLYAKYRLDANAILEAAAGLLTA
jgi:pyruvate dehydrogenase E1 component